MGQGWFCPFLLSPSMLRRLYDQILLVNAAVLSVPWIDYGAKQGLVVGEDEVLRPRVYGGQTSRLCAATSSSPAAPGPRADALCMLLSLLP